MIVVSLGANLGRARSPARDTLELALTALQENGCIVTARSRWFRSAPVPLSDQPDYVNGVALLESGHDPWALLERMHAVETAFGRLRAERWAARTLDLDLADYHGFITFNGWLAGRLTEPRPGDLCLPHPRAHERAFVLRPLAEAAPRWRHPVLGLGASELADRYARGQRCDPMTGNEEG
jgi:2-amino-4-hydroxy-6-hydroxymethyldihydropteridine diphosphokinase